MKVSSVLMRVVSGAAAALRVEMLGNAEYWRQKEMDHPTGQPPQVVDRGLSCAHTMACDLDDEDRAALDVILKRVEAKNREKFTSELLARAYTMAFQKERESGLSQNKAPHDPTSRTLGGATATERK